MIREQLHAGVVYAYLHPSQHDRTMARQFVVASVPDHGHTVWGCFRCATERTEVPTRLLRATWHDWQAGTTPEPAEYVHKDAKGVTQWLRRIAASPDASPELASAALRQLVGMGSASAASQPSEDLTSSLQEGALL